MLDHILGRPSSNWKRTQVLLTSLATYYFIKKRGTQPPVLFRSLNRRFQGYAPWQIIMGTWLVLHLLGNKFLLFGLNAPEPLARLYGRNFYRTSWILTALDAGFWTAMNIQPTFLRHFCSFLFTIHYLIFADEAEEKVRKYRATITVEQIRTSMEKSLHPIIHFISAPERPPVETVRTLLIPRKNPKFPPIRLLLFHPGPSSSLMRSRDLIFNVPGGGFVAMGPECHEEYLRQTTCMTAKTLISIDYGKAPEYPFPWALEECFEVYSRIVESDGKILGMNTTGDAPLRIVMFGDSAGGNLAAGVMLKVLESPVPLQHPEGIVFVYPCLDFRISAWMSTEASAVLRTESSIELPGLLESKDHMSHKSPLSLVPDTISRWRKRQSQSLGERVKEDAQRLIQTSMGGDRGLAPVGTRLMMSSRTCYVADRILPAETMRAMAILYIGPRHRPDFTKDYYLSPIVAPDHLLCQFPPVYLICGEKDPFVDDTVIFAGRIRSAKRRLSHQTLSNHPHADVTDVHIKLIKGASHGFFSMLSLLPEARGALRCCAGWINTLFREEGPRGLPLDELSSGLGEREWRKHEEWTRKAILEEELLMKRRRVAVSPALSSDVPIGIVKHTVTIAEDLLEEEEVEDEEEEIIIQTPSPPSIIETLVEDHPEGKVTTVVFDL